MSREHPRDVPGSAQPAGTTREPDARGREEQSSAQPRDGRSESAPGGDEVALSGEVRAFIEDLRAERAGLLEQLEKRSGLAHSLSEELSEPEDDVGLGTAQRDTDRLEPMLERAARRVDAIQHVLERAVQGLLTQCERCGQGIAIARLRALPETTLCVRCARELELRGQA